TEHGDYAYGYDDLYRLTLADNPLTSNEDYSYDKVGNRLTADGVVQEFVYNNNNELEDASEVGLRFEYDGNGNTSKRLDGAGGVLHDYVYDVDNRLVSVKDGAGGAIGGYGYDPFGRRLWKEVGGVRTWFFYSDEGLVGEYEYDSTVNEIKTYGWLPGSTWGTDPLFMAEGGQYYWYLNDHLGTPQKLINGSGQVVWSALYDAFGAAEVGGDSVVESNLRFPGQYFDGETGLHYNWHRYYDPETGRYVTVDPIGFRGGINVYDYVYGNAVNVIDPLGLHGSGGNIPPGHTPCISTTSCHNQGHTPKGNSPLTYSAGATLFTHGIEFSIDNEGCVYACWLKSPEIAGVGVEVTNSNGPGAPMKVYGGLTRRASIAIEPTKTSEDDFNANVSVAIGAGFLSSPYGVILRLKCWAVTKSNKYGCPCDNSAPDLQELGETIGEKIDELLR
ncbi:RHS domain-containing protein, partial [bacterium]|nr:RHS domain-containing protein [bacterium]